MSRWAKVKDHNIELSDDGETIEIYVGSDDQGSNYLEVSTERLRRLLKLRKILNGNFATKSN